MSYELLVVLIALFAGSFVKGVSGSGLPLVAIPFLTPIIGIENAIVTFLIPNVATNAWLLTRNREGRASSRNLLALSLSGCAGVVVGTFLLSSVREQLLSVLLGMLVLGYVVVALTRPPLRIADRTGEWSAPALGLLTGVLQGSTGVGGPLIIPYLHAYQMPRKAYLFSIAVLFQLFGIVQVAALASVGALTARWILVSAAALLPISIGLQLGMRYGSHLSNRTFDMWVLGILALIGLKLLSSIVV